MRYLVIGYTAKKGAIECSDLLHLTIGETRNIPPYKSIEKECLNRVKEKYGFDAELFRINFMQFMEKGDFESFIGVK